MTANELYAHWIKNYPEFKDELTSANDKGETEDRFYRSLEFGTGGMRGVIGAGENRMNIIIIRRVTSAFAAMLKDKQDGGDRHVVIAYDSRRNSDVFAMEAARTLATFGIKVMLFSSLRPVPMLSFAIRHTKAIAGIEITASHNPPQYNGYKVYWEDGAQLPPDKADIIVSYMKDDPAFTPITESEARGKGLIVDVPEEVDEAYITMVKGLAIQPDLLKQYGGELKIAYTPLHGSGFVPVTRVLREMGVTNLQVVKEQSQPDPNFSTVRVPNPEEKDSMKMVVDLAASIGADIAFATDPDSDRLGVAAREASGEYKLISGNQIGVIFIYYILSQLKQNGKLPSNGYMITTIVSTEMAEAIAASFGVKTRDVLTGFKFIAEQIEDIIQSGGTFLFGYEESYGYLSSIDVRDKDAVNASLLVAEIALWLKRSGKTLLQLIDELYEKYGYYADVSKSLAMPGKDGMETMREMMAGIRANPPKEFGGVKAIAMRDYFYRTRTDYAETKPYEVLPKSDVLYFELPDGFACVRPSGTEPKIKLYVNIRGDRKDQAESVASSVIAALEERLKDLH